MYLRYASPPTWLNLTFRAHHSTNDASEARETDQVHPHYNVANEDEQHLCLGLSPFAVIGSSTIDLLIASGFLPNTPPLLAEEREEDCIYDVSKIDRSIVSPTVIRQLIAHYSRCIHPAYPILSSECLYQSGTLLKQLSPFDRFVVLIGCGTAAAHKSYYCSNWKIISKVCYHWAEELAQPIIARRDEGSVMALAMLSIYELADPAKGALWDLFSFATRLCVQLGWRETGTTHAPVEGAKPSNIVDAAGKRRILTTLISIERY